MTKKKNKKKLIDDFRHLPATGGKLYQQLLNERATRKELTDDQQIIRAAGVEFGVKMENSAKKTQNNVFEVLRNGDAAFLKMKWEYSKTGYVFFAVTRSSGIFSTLGFRFDEVGDALPAMRNQTNDNKSNKPLQNTNRVDILSAK